MVKIKLVGWGLAALVALFFIFGSFTIVGAGERGVVLRLGKIDRTIEPGLHLKTPFLERVVKLETRTQKIEVEASAASKDLQIVTVNVALQFNLIPEQVGPLYEELRTEYRSRVIDPAIQDSVKSATAQFNAEALITRRSEVKDVMEADLKTRLATTHIQVTNLDIVNFDFSESFNAAIEQKVTAEQRALEAENKLKQVQFEAQQKVETAKAEAEAIRIQAQAITQQGGREFVNLKAVEKWNGVLPTQMIPGSAVPFINLER
jgi:regulator of protease activity HflC (stomatin/prohibitin superfamily)